MGEIKGKLEDASFKWIYPQEYEWVKGLVEQSEANKKTDLNQIIEEIKQELKEANIPYISVHGRKKHLYSLYRKLLKHDRDITKIYDLTAIRCILPTIADCYATLGIIHSRWTPLKGRIKDYISQPKPNGYQSLHTTVFYKKGIITKKEKELFND